MKPIVETARGTVGGRRVEGICSFLGIPYAATPVGAARFAAPAPAPAWEGVRPALEYSATCTQSPYPAPIADLLGTHIRPGDDYLTVNVWTPDPRAEGLPVLVWIHGGAFGRGGNCIPVYDGTAFARDGVVVVGVNYRLGIPGFAVLEGAPANRGLLDQLAALAWVQTNIHAFGGDPGNVTVFGESAGAMSIAALLASPAAAGLFARAIVQSGNATTAATAADADRVSAELAAQLGIAPTAAAFADIDPETLLAAQTRLALDLMRDPDPHRWGASIIRHGLALMNLFPTLDAGVVPVSPLDGIAAGRGHDIPLLIGTTSDEFRFFTVGAGLDGAITDATLPILLRRAGLDVALVEAYRTGRPDASPADLYAAIVTDLAFRDGSLRIAEQRATAAAPTFVYEFAWRTPVRGLDACHALELPFVFDTLDVAHSLTGDHPPQKLADRMHSAWVAFARTGDPGWARFTPDTQRVMVFDDPDSAAVPLPRAAELAALRAALGR
ncbi:carboxylesterase/lipase family protein [Nocardia sp. 2]|uniref:Carboxylic ester hydrolase n=1 Tax=Nocardia acididurans TaxID=2802282 RepID=A0ABS1M1U7_9NOCA|nr:carboxylesterase family protein [Nocardia acididurans]MBL1073794.1 carboxylesterase/lipase family protein [Nocardia acididurans]